MKKERKLRNGFEIGYIKTDHTGKQRIWSGNAFYIYEPNMETDIKKYMDSDSIKSFIKIALLIKDSK